MLSTMPHVEHIVTALVSKSVFYILPPTQLLAQNPRLLPREIVSRAFTDATHAYAGLSTAKKKTGRPSKVDKARNAKASVVSLGNWLEKNKHINTGMTADPAGAPLEDPVLDTDEATHALLVQRPMASLKTYRMQKEELVRCLESDNMYENLEESDQTDSPLSRANSRLLERLKHIDALASLNGLEIGTEGGDRSGIER